MIPSRHWFPSGLQERAAWYQNFAEQFALLANQLGFFPSDVAIVEADNTTMQALADNDVTTKAFVEGQRNYRITITEGSVGDPKPPIPGVPVLDPVGDPATGLFERLDDYVKRTRVSPAYTPLQGGLLGIIPSGTPNIPVQDLKPVIKASLSEMDYKFSLNVTRLGMTAFKVQIQRAGSETWQDAAFATNNPAEVRVTPTTPGQPERILVRAILLDKNEPVGIPSDPTFVTVNP